MEKATALNGTLWPSLSTQEPFRLYRTYGERQMFAALYIMVSIIGVAGNTFVIAAVVLSRRLRTVTNVFVVSLSTSDLISCFFLPWEAVAVLGENGWPLPQAPWICVTASAVLHVSYGCSINSLALIAVNRWVGITKSGSTSRRIYTRRNIAFMVALSWALPLGIISVPLLTDYGEHGYEPLYSACGWVKANPYTTPLAVTFCICFFPIQLCIIMCCYISIFRYVLKTSRRMLSYDTQTVSGEVSGAARAKRMNMWKRKIAVTKNLAYIVLAYVICQSPYFLAVTQQKYEWGIRLTMYSIAILYCNLLVNPAIYATSHPYFKEAFTFMVRCKDIPEGRVHSQRTFSTSTSTR
ncbi:alpha-1D adrenergic receptor-like [Patiria miniata]|uniref:G-protein coupled receptors family 1 profile domain-containing protein n=1 Tax=Patiria miniata TaxID=46514 RepID=A0A913YWA1_PATMI|nr:alpha-1D adrenergic receptor-like [Patiria miniata]